MAKLLNEIVFQNSVVNSKKAEIIEEENKLESIVSDFYVFLLNQFNTIEFQNLYCIQCNDDEKNIVFTHKKTIFNIFLLLTKIY